MQRQNLEIEVFFTDVDRCSQPLQSTEAQSSPASGLLQYQGTHAVHTASKALTSVLQERSALG